MFRKLMEFHKRTMEIYNKDIEESMEDWKKKVMKIHEEAEFLFYADEIDDEAGRGNCVIRGDLVRGKKEIGDEICIFDGEGNLLATARLRGETEEKEQQRRGIIHHKRNEFKAKILTIDGENVETMVEEKYRRRFLSLAMNFSLITDTNICSEKIS